MNNMVKSKSSTKLVVAILSIAFVSQINTIASVIMADLSRVFPGASPTAIQYVMQFGMIGGFPVSLSVGFLSRKFRMKPMIMIGLMAILIGGLIPILSHSSLAILYVCAFIVGAGQGFMAPLLGTIVLQSFEGKMQTRMIGLNTTFATGGATVLLLLAGPICLTGWVNTYFLYFFALPVMIIAIAFLPLGEKPAPANTSDGEKSRAPVPGRAFIQAALIVIMFIGYVTFPLNIGMFIDTEGIGDAAATGVCMSIITVVGALFGIVLPSVIKVVKAYIGTFSAFFGLVGTVVICFAKSIEMAYFSAVLVGIYFGSAIAGNGYIVGRICRPEQIGPSFSVIMSSITLGVILSPVIVNLITGLWGGVGSLGAFTTSAAVFIIAIVLQIIWGAYVTKACPEKKEEPAPVSADAPQA